MFWFDQKRPGTFQCFKEKSLKSVTCPGLPFLMTTFTEDIQPKLARLVLEDPCTKRKHSCLRDFIGAKAK